MKIILDLNDLRKLIRGDTLTKEIRIELNGAITFRHMIDEVVLASNDMEEKIIKINNFFKKDDHGN